ncbi:hypothetical protein ABEV00_21935 [Paenibacillus thiaminolyticus]|uniref:hypothetical protein n=1 Tax=Paenibacillus thiaminolyticus TaxID=49283 RepID=UPI003D2ABDC5
METSFQISENGRIDATTKTWTSDPWRGFTGSVVIFLTDTSGNILHATDTHRYGVDGVRVGDPSRQDTWDETIPDDVLRNMTGYAIWQAHTPVPRITPDLFKEWSEAIAPIIEIFASAVARHSNRG